MSREQHWIIQNSYEKHCYSFSAKQKIKENFETKQNIFACSVTMSVYIFCQKFLNFRSWQNTYAIWDFSLTNIVIIYDLFSVFCYILISVEQSLVLCGTVFSEVHTDWDHILLEQFR